MSQPKQAERAIVDYADARAMMVDGQIRPNKVYASRLLAALRALPRERFAPAELAGPAAARAYADEDVPLGGGRVLMEPMVIARLLQTAAAREGERTLVVGAGTGYGAALLAACGSQVTALDDDPRLLAVARRLLSEFAPDIRVVEGPLRDGWVAGAPYDLILIEGGVVEIPPALAPQLAVRGRLLAVRMVGRLGQAILAEPIPGRGNLAMQPVFDCATALLPSLRPAPGFTF